MDASLVLAAAPGAGAIDDDLALAERDGELSPECVRTEGLVASVNAGCVTSVRNRAIGGTPGGIMSRTAPAISGE
jgi:hypothetical protein